MRPGVCEGDERWIDVFITCEVSNVEFCAEDFVLYVIQLTELIHKIW